MCTRGERPSALGLFYTQAADFVSKNAGNSSRISTSCSFLCRGVMKSVRCLQLAMSRASAYLDSRSFYLPHPGTDAQQLRALSRDLAMFGIRDDVNTQMN